MQERNEQIFTDLGTLCEPKANISAVRELHKWNSVPFETADLKGTMLVSFNEGRPADVTLPLNLTGWYRVFLGVGLYGDEGVRLRLRLPLRGGELLALRRPHRPVPRHLQAHEDHQRQRHPLLGPGRAHDR